MTTKVLSIVCRANVKITLSTILLGQSYVVPVEKYKFVESREKIKLKLLIRAVVPVSYTHLDVYKRQMCLTLKLNTN